MRSNKYISTKIYSVYIVLSLFASLLCLHMGMESINDRPLFLLPLSYGLMLAVCRNLRKNFLSLSVIIINTVCLIRFALYPTILIVENYTCFSTESIYLLTYDCIAVLLFLNLYSRRLSNANSPNVREKHMRLGVVNKLLILITLILVLIDPSLLSFFAYFGGKSGVSGAISILFSVGMVVMYVTVLTKLSKFKSLSGFALVVALMFACIYLFLSSFGEENVQRWNFLFIGIPTIFILIYSFAKYRKLIITVSSTAIILSIFIGSFLKFSISEISVNSFISNFIDSESLGEYFGGLSGITNSLLFLRDNYYAISFESTLTDLFGNMPIISHYFNTDLYSTESLYLDALGRTDLICPLLTQSVLHFGVLGAPVLSIIMVIIAVESDCYSKTTRSMYSMFGAITMCVIFSMFMCLNTTILMPNAWKYIIYLIVQYINEKIYLHGKTIYNSAGV